jgi:hypothetical protein
MISICAFVFTSCNSSRHIAGTYSKNNRSYSKSTGKHYKTTPHKKRKHRSIKCYHIKAQVKNQENQILNIPENKDKSDFTLIFPKEHKKYYNPDTPDNDNYVKKK